MTKCDLFFERRLMSTDSSLTEDLAARVYCPFRAKSNWSCKFSVDSDQDHKEDEAHGEDAIQALLNAIIGLDILLTTLHPECSWLGSGSTGFSILSLPIMNDRDSAGIVRRHLESEMGAIMKRLKG